MSDTVKVSGAPTSYKASLPEGRRYAVQTAAELIHAHVTSGCSPGTFESHIEKIGEYADAIEKALKNEE